MPAFKNPGEDDDYIDTTALPNTQARGPMFEDAPDEVGIARSASDRRAAARGLGRSPMVEDIVEDASTVRRETPRGITPPPSVMIGNVAPDDHELVDDGMMLPPDDPQDGFGVQSPAEDGGTPSQQIGGLFVTNFHFRRSRTYAFVVDNMGRPIEIGSGSYARVFLGQERWSESLTELQRLVVIKMLHRRINEDDAQRFRIEKELLERVQGHPGIVEVLGSGTCTDPRLPAAVNELCGGEFMILEKLDMNLEERLRGTRDMQAREDLLAFDMHDRLLRVLEYMIPIASAVEYAHLMRNVCHRDINPANILIRLADPKLAGSKMQVRLADFGVAKAQDQAGVTRFAHGVPGRCTSRVRSRRRTSSSFW
jgi:hypothetical protein